LKPPHVVLDTNILVSALLSKTGNPAKIYKMFFAGLIALVFSEDILLEYKDVLYRPHLHILADDADKVLEAIQHYGESVNPTSSMIPMVDEDDRIFYDAAIIANAYLITGNTRHYPKESFILAPAEFIKL
jgi:putative PIN family toxin of toxin-antitoxin system